MDENRTPEVQSTPAQMETSLTTIETGQAPTIWNNDNLMRQAYKAAKFLSASDLVPEGTYKGHPENCLIALDLANRMALAPLLVMQNLYIVKGKPAWSGQFCISAVNNSGRFTPLDFVFLEDGGCYAQATRLSDGHLCCGTVITPAMVKSEGWLDKPGSKWKAMPQQMYIYRAASFFCKAYCPDILMGLQTVEEVRDVNGYEEQKPTVTIEL